MSSVQHLLRFVALYLPRWVQFSSPRVVHSAAAPSECGGLRLSDFVLLAMTLRRSSCRPGWLHFTDNETLSYHSRTA